VDTGEREEEIVKRSVKAISEGSLPWQDSSRSARASTVRPGPGRTRRVEVALLLKRGLGQGGFCQPIVSKGTCDDPATAQPEGTKAKSSFAEL